MGPVMLALSKFRQSEKAVDIAIEKAKDGGHLVIVYIVDVNLARYLIGTDIGIYPEIQDSFEEDLLERYKKEGAEKVEAIMRKAKESDISVKTYVDIGRFAYRTLEIVEKEKPSLIITTRSNRPKWVRKLFGSPVDQLIERAKCPLIES